MTDVQKAGFLFLRRLRLAKAPFTKLAATPEQLLEKLETRGLIVSTATKHQALAYLRFVGGYRLKGYWFHVVNPNTKQFPAGYTFEQISDRCELDRELRAATITAIDRLEVAIRSVMANFLSLKHSPHWFLDPNIFKPTRTWGIGKLIKKIEDEVGRSESKRFVGHYYHHHDDPYLPPSWAISECVTFGLWSRTFAILRNATDKKARDINFSDPKSFYAAATVIQYLLSQTGLPHNWKADLNAIFNKYPSVQTGDLGFPANWQLTAGW